MYSGIRPAVIKGEPNGITTGAIKRVTINLIEGLAAASVEISPAVRFGIAPRNQYTQVRTPDYKTGSVQTRRAPTPLDTCAVLVDLRILLKCVKNQITDWMASWCIGRTRASYIWDDLMYDFHPE